MKILFTGFYGFDNPSHIIVDKIDTDKIILKNSFEEINKKLALVNIEDYDLIIILGLRDKLKKRLKIEVNSMLACEELSTKLDYKKLAKHFKDNNVPCIINDKKKAELNYHSYQNKKLQINESISSVRLHELMAGTNTPLDFIGNKISYTVNPKQNNDLSSAIFNVFVSLCKVDIFKCRIVCKAGRTKVYAPFCRHIYRYKVQTALESTKAERCVFTDRCLG